MLGCDCFDFHFSEHRSIVVTASDLWREWNGSSCDHKAISFLFFELRHKSPDNASVAGMGSDVDGRRSPWALWSLSRGDTRCRRCYWPRSRVRGTALTGQLRGLEEVQCDAVYSRRQLTLFVESNSPWLQQCLERSLTRRSIRHRSRSRACAFLYSACFEMFWWGGCKLRIDVLYSTYYSTSFSIIRSHVNRAGCISKRLSFAQKPFAVKCGRISFGVIVITETSVVNLALYSKHLSSSKRSPLL